MMFFDVAAVVCVVLVHVVFCQLTITATDQPFIPGPPPILVLAETCAFTSDLCNWVNELEDDFDWVLGNNCTLSNNTGPCTDHTLYPTTKGVYLYLESSYPRRHGDTALLSRPGRSWINCLRFWFHMWGQDTGHLSIYYQASNANETLLAWQISGNQGNQWKYAEVSFHGDDVLKIVIEGTRGPGFHGDIAIDDLQVSQESCQGTAEGVPLKQIAHWRMDGSEHDVRLATYSEDGGRTVLHVNHSSSKPVVPSVDIGTSSFTVALWIKTTFPQAENQYFISATDQFHLLLTSQGKLRGKLGDNQGPKKTSASYGDVINFPGGWILNNTWTHVALSWNDSNHTAALFIDAVHQSSESSLNFSLSSNQSDFYTIGWAEFRPLMILNGLLRDLKIFQKALNEAELQIVRSIPCDPPCHSPGFCDNETGHCVCGMLEHVTSSCENALNITIYADAVAYLPMDTQDLLNLKDIGGYSGERSFVIGPVNEAALFNRTEVSFYRHDFSVCLFDLTDCPAGFSMAFWVNILTLNGSKAFLFSPRPFFKFHKRRGINLKVLNTGTGILLQINVASNSVKCEVQLKFSISTWVHVAFTWVSDRLDVFLNGFPLRHEDLETSSCSSTQQGTRLQSVMIVGSYDMVWLLDDVALWERQLHEDDIRRVYETVTRDIGKKIQIEAKILNESWHDKLQDPESVIYRNFTERLLFNFLQLFDDEALDYMEVDQLRAGSVDANFSLSFNNLSHEHILILEEALFINKSVGNMAVESANWTFRDHIPHEPPASVQVQAANESSIEVTWVEIPPESFKGALQGYRILFREQRGVHKYQHFMVRGAASYAKIEGLFANTNYSIRVLAVNVLADGPPSEPVVTWTPARQPSSPPTNVTVVSTGPHYIHITWSPVLISREEGTILGYDVHWKSTNDSFMNKLRTGSLETTVNITSLQDFTWYELTVQAFNGVGPGPNSSLIYVRTNETAAALELSIPLELPTPQNITVNATSCTSVTVEWLPVSRNLSHETYNYTVRWASVTQGVMGVRTNVTTNSTSYKITGLTCFTEYNIQIAAQHWNLTGNFSDPVSVWTLEGALDLTTPLKLPTPQNITANVTSCTFVTVEWLPVSRNLSHETYNYTVLWASVTQGSLGVRTNVTTNRTSYKITGLTCFTEYKIQIAAQHWNLTGNFSDPVMVWTPESVPSLPPQNITGYNTSSRSLRISWDPVPQDFVHGRLQGYRLKYWVKGQEMFVRPKITTVNQTTTRVVIGELQPFTSYLVDVSGFTSVGEGNCTRIEVTTAEGVPGRPGYIHGININSTTVLITWDNVPQGHANGRITGYNVYINSLRRIAQGRQNRRMIMRGLTKLTPQRVQVSANTSQGEGIKSRSITLWTDDGVPCDPPVNVTAYDVAATRASIQWTYQTNCSVPGFIKGYRLVYRSLAMPYGPSYFLEAMGENRRTATLAHLKPFTTYQVQVQVMTNSGRDGLPTKVRITTKENVPGGAPSRFEAYMVWKTEVFLRWSSVPLQHQHGAIQGFKVLYRPVGGVERVITVGEGGRRSCVISGLQPFTEINVRILAFTSAGDGVTSPSISIVTKEDVPSSPPLNVTVTDKTSTDRLLIQWLKVPDEYVNGVLIGYVVSYQAVKVGGRKVNDGDLKKRRVGTYTYSFMLDDVKSFTIYEIRVAGLTRQGEGVLSQPIYGETCHCGKNLTTNYWSYPPYVISSSPSNMSGIFMAFLDDLVLHCCGNCQNGHGLSNLDYRLDGSSNRTRKSTEKEMREDIGHYTDLNFPVYGYYDQRKYMNYFRFVPVVESPGAAFIVSKEQFKSRSLIVDLVYGCGPLLLFNVSAICFAGMLVWMSENCGNSTIFPRSFLKGFPEGIWWSFVTMSTVGYGDRTPMTTIGRLLTVLWMLSGTVLFSLLISYISSGCTVASLTNNMQLYGSKVAALQNTPEFRLGIRRNAQMNTVRNYSRLEEIREDLLRGDVRGALIDTYVAAARSDLFDDPNLYIHQLIHYHSSLGIVLSGNSTIMQHCFLDYLVDKRSLLISVIKNNTKTLPHPETSPAEQKVSGLLGSSKEKRFKATLVYLSITTGAAMLGGLIFDVVMRRKQNRRIRSNDDSSQKLRYKRELQREMNQLVQEFYTNMKATITTLTKRHRNEKRLVLSLQRKEARTMKYCSTSKQRSAVNNRTVFLEDLCQDEDL